MLALVAPIACLAPSPALSASQEPPTFASMLEKTPWNVESRGPLLVVGAEGISPKLPLPEPSAQGYNLASLATAFDLVPLRLKTLTVLAPRQGWEIRRPTVTAEELLRSKEEYCLLELLVSLDTAQWKELTSEKGLGRESLNADQQALLAAVQAHHSFVSSQGTPVAVSEQQRRQLRLRLGQRAQVLLFPLEPNGVVSPLVPPDAPKPPSISLWSSEQTQARYETLPTRPKASALELSSLTARASLVPSESVGQLLKRLATATKLPLTASPWLAELTVTTRGSSAAVGELLQALCRATDSTFRRVGSGPETLYVLTHDQEGIATQLARWSELDAKARALLELHLERQHKRLAGASRPIPVQDAYNIPAELRQKGSVALTELPRELQQTLQKQASTQTYSVFQNNQEVAKPFRTDRVGFVTETTGSLILPGIGELPYHGLADLAGVFLPDGERPLSTPSLSLWKERVVVLAPHTVEEAREAVALAKKAQQTALWLAVSSRPHEARPLLEAAISEGKKNNLSVGALVRPLWGPKNELVVAGPEDQNLLGATIPELFARHPSIPTTNFFFWPTRAGQSALIPTQETQQATVKALTELAKTDGLAGLAIQNLTPPFYLEQAHASSVTSDQFGYNLPNRLAFLQQTGCDPLDLFAQDFSLSDAPPELRQLQAKQWKVNGAWRGFLQTSGEGFLKTLHPALQLAAPKLPLYLMRYGSLVPWNKPLPTPAPSTRLRWLDAYFFLGKTDRDFLQGLSWPDGPQGQPLPPGYVAFLADIPWSDARGYLERMAGLVQRKETP